MKNVLKILAVILGFLVAIGLLLAGAFKLSMWNCGIFLLCLCVFAGLAFLYFIVSKSKDVYGKATLGAWLSGSMFLLSFGVFIPIWIFNVESIWLGYTADALILLGTILWLIGEISRLRN